MAVLRQACFSGECAAASEAQPHRPSRKLKTLALVSTGASLMSFGLLELSAVPLLFALLD
jgi:hypothetical protein